jgi:hypothetical protein
MQRCELQAGPIFGVSLSKNDPFVKGMVAEASRTPEFSRSPTRKGWIQPKFQCGIV